MREQEPDNVTPIRREEYDGMLCEECGSAWFDMTATMSADGNEVTGWAHVACHDCGNKIVPG